MNVRGGRGITTAVASIAALVTVLAVSSIMTATLLGRLSTVSAATSERLARANEKIHARLSTVYHVPPILVVSNDGTVPVTITRLYLDGGESGQSLTIAPGEKAELFVGLAERIAVEVEGWGVMVLETVKAPQLPGQGDGGGSGMWVDFKCQVVGNIMPVWFQAITYGGVPPYTYSLDYGDGTVDTHVGYLMLKRHFYTSTPRTATLTVVDRENNTASASLTVLDQCGGVPP